MSTCDHEALTASFLVTRVLRTPTYCPKATKAISARTAITIRTLTILPPESSSHRNGQTPPERLFAVCHLSLSSILSTAAVTCCTAARYRGKNSLASSWFGASLWSRRSRHFRETGGPEGKRGGASLGGSGFA